MRTATAVVLGVAATGFTLLLFDNLSGDSTPVRERVRHEYPLRGAQFERVMGNLLGPPLVGGNRVTPLQNGEEIFPAMLAAIRDARRTVTLESFIYWSGRVGHDFTEAISERARSGVACHLLLDWVGSEKIDEAMLRRMREAGVEVERYHPVRWHTLSRLNHRTHRKLLVVDGRVGFTGGVGIADQWLGRAQSPAHWRDSHFRVEGPVVAQLQAAFVDNWLETRGRVLDGEGYFPPLEPRGQARAQVFRSSADGGSESIHLMYLLSIAAATGSIRIANSYFVPDPQSVEALVEASRRGARVELIVPGEHIDTPLVTPASRASWGALLAAGVHVYRYQPTMYHCKVMVVDDVWSSVGSTNFDNRSFRLNDEANLNVLDPAFAAELARVFEQDKARSRRVTLAEWRRRPLRERLSERLSSLFESQL